jgi:hypothetical protein
MEDERHNGRGGLKQGNRPRGECPLLDCTVALKYINRVGLETLIHTYIRTVGGLNRLEAHL